MVVSPVVIKRMATRKESAKSALDEKTALARHGFYFQEVALASGVNFVHRAPTLDHQLDHIMPEVASMGAAVSIVDFDRDGWPDIYFTNAPTVEMAVKGQKSRGALYHNNRDGTFKDVTDKSGLTASCFAMGGAVGDYDNDGWPDVYVACDTTPNLLYHNNQNGTFTEIGKTAGVAYGEDGSMQAGMGVSAADYMHDGYQDIVKTNFSDDTPTVFLNRGHDAFDDVTRTVLRFR